MKKFLLLLTLAFSLGANAQIVESKKAAKESADSTKLALKAAKPKKESFRAITASYLGSIPTGGHAMFLGFSNTVVKGLGSDFALSSDFQNYVGLHLDMLNYTFEFTKPSSKARLFMTGAFGINELFYFHGNTVADHFNTAIGVSPRFTLLLADKILINAGYRGSFIVNPSVTWGNSFTVGLGYKF